MNCKSDGSIEFLGMILTNEHGYNVRFVDCPDYLNVDGTVVSLKKFRFISTNKDTLLELKDIISNVIRLSNGSTHIVLLNIPINRTESWKQEDHYANQGIFEVYLHVGGSTL